ncbi:MAG: hypothetical protein JWN36_2125 [Microbacteriaceae bacterium]|nr:hypothetical protein [Microbacteriaceae bacterium]
MRHGRILRGIVSSLALAGLLVGSLAVSASAEPVTAPAAPVAKGPTDSASAASEADASAIARSFGHPVVVDSSTTETTQISALPDGQMQLVSSSQPVRVKSKGSWTPVDATLQRSADGTVAPAAVSVKTAFGGGGSSLLARVQTNSGTWISETWPYGALPTPSLSGASATYSEALPGVDVVLTANVTGMSEVFVVKNAAAAADPRVKALTVGVTGAAQSLVAGGRTLATAPDGSFLSSSTPTWWDSSISGANATGPAPGAFPEALDHSVAGSSLTLDAAPAVEDTTKYPLYIDPDWTGQVDNDWFIDQGHPTTVYLNQSTRLKVGPASAVNSSDGVAHLARAYWKMDTTGVTGVVTAAHFNSTETYAGSCTPTGVALWEISDTDPGSTWNTTATNWLQNMTTQVVAHGRAGCPAAAVGFDAYAAVADAQARHPGYVYLGMRATSESGDTYYKEFSPTATITITYDSRPNVPAAAQMTSPPRACSTNPNAPVWVNSTSGLTLQVTSTDPDVGQNVATHYFVVRPGTTVPVVYTTGFSAGGPQPYTIGAGDLAPGAYSWFATTSDNIVDSSATTSCYFNVRNTAPPSPTVAPPSVPTTVGVGFTPSISAASSDGIAEFAYWWAVQGAGTPAVPVTAPGPNGALPPCSSVSGIVTFVCVSSGGLPATPVSVAPVDDSSTLWVASYDQAGNVSTPVGIDAGAGADATNISYGAGHGWSFDALTAPFTSTIQDSNTNSGAALTSALPLVLSSGVARNQTAVLPGQTGAAKPVISSPGFVTLARGFNSTTLDHRDFTEGAPPSGYVLQAPQGMIASPALTKPTGTNSLYSCQITATDEMTSNDAACEGTGVTGVRLGYIWTYTLAQPAGYIPLYRCHFSGDHYDSTDVACEGHPSDGLLGYLAPMDQSQTARPAVDTTQSFTASAWIKPSMGTSPTASRAIMSQQDASGQGFVLLEQANGQLQFCLTSQASPLSRDCVQGATVSDGTWVFVTAVWDRVNQQLRLSLGSAVSLSATAHHSVSGSDVAANAPLVLGGMSGDGMHEGQWSGLLDDPTIFPGVPDGIQISNLYHLKDPNSF